LGPDGPRNSGAGVPAGGRGRAADPDWLGASPSPSGFRRRVQADLPGYEPSHHAGSATSSGAGGRGGREREAGMGGRRKPDAASDPCGGRATRSVLVDQPLGRRSGTDPPRGGRASSSGAGSSGGPGAATVPGTAECAGGPRRGGQSSLAGGSD